MGVGPVENLDEVLLDEEYLTKVIKVRKELKVEISARLVEFLKKNHDAFTWSHMDMVGISPSVISHVLNIDKNYPPVQQKRRLLDKDRSQALKEEVERLKENNFIRDAYYPDWVSNPVLVPKPNGKWRTCMDFPLPRIDHLVDATAKHEILSFIDPYSGYNQIIMHPPDEEHTSLKNTGTTYQRLVNGMF